MKIVVFDLDETLGYFTEFGIFWDSLVYYVKSKNKKILTQNDFNDVLDLYPEFLRPNIINILTYLKEKKHHNCCHKNPHNIQSITQFLSDIFGKTKK